MEENLARLVETALDRLGDCPALFFEGAWHTSGDLHARATRVAGGLRGLGVGPGDRVIVVMANCPEVVIAYSAIWRAGAVVTPVVFLVSAQELRHILDDSGAVAVLTTPEILPKVAEAVGDRRLPVAVVGQNFAELEAADPVPITDRNGSDLAALLYTGGTTGRSKGVPLTHVNLSVAGASSRSVTHVRGLTRGMTALPLSHSYGILVTVGTWHVPEPVSSVLQRFFEPRQYLALAAEHAVQTMAVVPSMLAMLLGQPLEEFDLRNLRHVFSGAAPLPLAVAEAFEARVPSARVFEGYGCTESAGLITSTPPGRAKRGTVGIAVPGVELRIAGPDGADVASGVDGEVVVRGQTVMERYWGGEPLADGWFHTGDVGRLDDEGYLTIVDRMKDLIIRGGYNVYPRDVEEVLQQHPAVAMAAVVGRPDERLGEEVVGYVSLVPGQSVTGPELVAFAKERLSATKYPREVSIVETIPLTSVGKLDRKRLRRSAAGTS